MHLLVFNFTKEALKSQKYILKTRKLKQFHTVIMERSQKALCT